MKSRVRLLRGVVPGLAAILVASACGQSAENSVTDAGSTVERDTLSTTTTSLWPTYHRTRWRSGDDRNEPSFARMRSVWTGASLDGAVYAEPLVASNSVILATENNSVYALNVTTGAQIWHRQLGAPRTANFPCGDIDPLGITGTPVIVGKYIYVVAEVQLSPTAFAFHLAKLLVSTGQVIYNRDVTPAGMNTNTQQQRSALNVSNGNIVITWGGLAGDCGSYHGYVETVAKTTGAPVAAVHDTGKDNEGGIWAASGPAVDSAGNIFVSTGNGTSTAITQYDYGNSVVKLTPALVVSSFFAPGPPQSWTQLNASDLDLGSTGPSLLRNGLLFAIGKGGRGYLLSQSRLPDNSNPGGGENFSAQVCHSASRGAFSGLAVAGSNVFVPCSDGIVKVHVDSAFKFHTVWYSTAGSSAPILAGGVVWTLQMFGGSKLYGLSPRTGNLVLQLALPATTEHFATPTSADGRLFVAAGTHVVAFAPSP